MLAGTAEDPADVEAAVAATMCALEGMSRVACERARGRGKVTCACEGARAGSLAHEHAIKLARPARWRFLHASTLKRWHVGTLAAFHVFRVARSADAQTPRRAAAHSYRQRGKRNEECEVEQVDAGTQTIKQTGTIARTYSRARTRRQRYINRDHSRANDRNREALEGEGEVCVGEGERQKDAET
eukprot:118580-Pleurochrysis_carterae.AAC.1